MPRTMSHTPAQRKAWHKGTKANQYADHQGKCTPSWMKFGFMIGGYRLPSPVRHVPIPRNQMIQEEPESVLLRLASA